MSQYLGELSGCIIRCSSLYFVSCIRGRGSEKLYGLDDLKPGEATHVGEDQSEEWCEPTYMFDIIQKNPINDISPEDEHPQGYAVGSISEEMKGTIERAENSVKTKNSRSNDDSEIGELNSTVEIEDNLVEITEERWVYHDPLKNVGYYF